MELDVEVSADQLPVTQGMERETKINSPKAQPQPLLAKETRKFISPANFYGTIKPKVKLPL